MIILGLEASTTSAKAVVFDTADQEVTVRARRFVLESGDSSVRDAESIFAQLVALGRETVSEAQASDRQVGMVVLCGTWHGLTLRDGELREVTPVQEWPYTGAQDLCARLRQDQDLTRWFYERTGCMVNAAYPAFKLKLLREQGTDISDSWVLDQNSYNFARLTSQMWTSRSQASGTGLLSTLTGEWDEEVISRLGLGRLRLPELHDSTDTAPVTSGAAALLGVPAGIPVLVPGPDGGMNQVGNAAADPGQMTFSMGTSGALRFAVSQPSLSPRMSTWSYRSPVGWLSGAATSGCTNCVDWAKERFFGADVSFDQLEAQLDPSARDLPTFMPFLFGERSPGWQDQRRGGFLELHPDHSRLDMYQSVLHGVTFSLYHCYQELTALNGRPHQILLSGGVLSSPFWTQLTADIFGEELQVTALQHSSVVGAVRMGLRAAGIDDDQPAFDDTPRRIVTPSLTRHHQYAEQFQHYLELYARTNPERQVELPASEQGGLSS